MRKALVIPAAVVLFLGAAAAMADDCVCAADKMKDGWCSKCNVGYIDGVQVKSEKLFKAVEGMAVASDEVKCAGCKTAMAKNGTCEHCHVSFAGGREFTSWVGHDIAAGKLVDTSAIKCDECKAAAKDHGWCDACKRGLVDNRSFTDKDAYEHAVKARKVLEEAAKAAGHCEGCAIAMVTDGTCKECNASFKGGKMVKAEKP